MAGAGGGGNPDVAAPAVATPGDLAATLDAVDPAALGADVEVASGKVRDWVDLGDRLLLITTDRVSAFDRVLTTIPLKGQLLNQMSLFWFGATADLVPNHIVTPVTARSVLVDKVEVIPVEVVVRSYLTGSAYRDYLREGAVSGISLPKGMRFNQRFEQPLLTPATKAPSGEHDISISREQVLGQNLVKREVWEAVEGAAMRLYEYGVQHAARQGLILVDTKYEFGIRDGEPVLADEVHTPDSSRYWYADSYEALFQEGQKQRKLDKEYLRQWLMDHDYMGDGEPPPIPDSLRLEVANRYAQAYREITGTELAPERHSREEEYRRLTAALGG